MKPRITIVIPTWNRKDLLADCLASIRAQTFDAYHVIVVDDGSTDKTADYVAAEFPEVQLIHLPANKGFCVAANAGIREADTEFVLLLNNDMTLDLGFLDALVAASEASDAALFAPLVLWRDQPEVVYSAGDRQRVNGRPESIGFRQLLAEFEPPPEIFGISAGAGLYRREVFEQLGLLDEQFGAYFEDSDLSFRARLAGYRAEFVREAVAYHVGSASLEGRTWWRARQCCRNHALLVIKNMPARLLLRHAPEILCERLHQIRSFVSAARGEFGLAKALIMLLQLWGSLFTALPHALKERAKIQRRRTLDIEALDAILTHE